MVNPSYWYCGSDKWTAVTAWAANIAKSVGNLVRQNAAPTVGNERVFVCIVAGTTTNGAEPTWTVTKGAKTTDNTVTWMECTGQPGVNGNTTDCQTWTADAKSNTVALGQIIYDSGTSSLQICTTAGTAGSGAAPSFSATAGTTTADNTVTWTSLGLASNFATWAAPHDRFSNATAANWMSAGNVCFFSSTHAETNSAATTVNFVSGTNANPTYHLSVDATASATSAGCTLLSGASVSTTGASNLTIGQNSANYTAYMYGFTFNAGSAANSASLTTLNANTSTFLYYDTCTLNLANSNAASVITLGYSAGGYVGASYYNCTFTFGSTSQHIVVQEGEQEIVNGTFANSGSVPTTLFKNGSGGTNMLLRVRDSDLSAITGTLLAFASPPPSGRFSIENSKLGAAVTMTSGTLNNQGSYTFKLHNCDSGSKNYRFYEKNYMATIQQETTTIHTGGATDGTTPISWNIATSANTTFAAPYVSPEIVIWQDTTGSSKTATVEIAGASTLTNGDIWMEIEYLGNASFPIASVANNRKSSIVAANSNVTSSGASWGGSPASTQKLQITFTPQMKGPIKARIFVAKPSITVYVEPLIT